MREQFSPYMAATQKSCTYWNVVSELNIGHKIISSLITCILENLMK
jgi:hypothetical protein